MQAHQKRCPDKTKHIKDIHLEESVIMKSARGGGMAPIVSGGNFPSGISEFRRVRIGTLLGVYLYFSTSYKVFNSQTLHFVVYASECTS